MCVRAVLAVLLLFVASVAAQEGGVTFWREDFIMSCPEDGAWFSKNDEDIGEGQTLRIKYENDKKGPYYCKYGEDEKYYFYVQGKVCANCFELDGTLFAGAIIVDMVMTGFLMSLIYWYTKKKSSAGFTHTSKAPARSGGRGPPVPSPDYEQLQPGTLSQGTYSSVNRMG